MSATLIIISLRPKHVLKFQKIWSEDGRIFVRLLPRKLWIGWLVASKISRRKISFENGFALENLPSSFQSHSQLLSLLLCLFLLFLSLFIFLTLSLSLIFLSYTHASGFAPTPSHTLSTHNATDITNEVIIKVKFLYVLTHHCKHHGKQVGRQADIQVSSCGFF